MRRQDQVEAMKKILEVRQLQQLAAQMEVARADQALRRRQALRDEDAQAATGDQEAWARVVAAPSLSLAIVGAWAAQVERSQARLRQADADVTTAEEEKSERTEAWRASQTRAEAAETLADAAFARARRAREEAALAELSDRTSRRRTGP